MTGPTAFSSHGGERHAKLADDRNMEILMRLTPIALSVAIALATMASAGHGQRPDAQIEPQSLALLQQGEPLTASGRYDAAVDALETALIFEPRNRAAYSAKIGRAHV